MLVESVELLLLDHPAKCKMLLQGGQGYNPGGQGGGGQGYYPGGQGDGGQGYYPGNQGDGGQISIHHQ